MGHYAQLRRIAKFAVDEPVGRGAGDRRGASGHRARTGAAIPATIMYNLLNRRLAEYRHRLADMATMVNSLTGREVESRHISR